MMTYGIELYANQQVVSDLIHFVCGVVMTTAITNWVFEDTEPLVLVMLPVCLSAFLF